MATENNGGNNGGASNLKPWKPGQSGNPGGRPKGLAAKIRQATNEGQELVDIHLAILRCEFPTRLTVGDILKSAAWLADRGWGKAPETIKLEGGEKPVGITATTDPEKLTRVINILVEHGNLSLEQIRPALGSGNGEPNGDSQTPNAETD